MPMLLALPWITPTSSAFREVLGHRDELIMRAMSLPVSRATATSLRSRDSSPLPGRGTTGGSAGNSTQEAARGERHSLLQG